VRLDKAPNKNARKHSVWGHFTFLIDEVVEVTEQLSNILLEELILFCRLNIHNDI
jgi:hypothetical protein